MSEEQEQFIEQQRVNLLDGLQVEASAEIGIDVDGRYFAAPLVQLHIDGSRVVLQVDDEHRSDQWVRISIAEELFDQIYNAHVDAALAEGDGEQHGDEPQPLDVFDVMWDKAASESRCDERGGMEYQRVRSEWDRLYGKLVALDFILNRANQVPDQKTNAQDRSGSTNADPAG